MSTVMAPGFAARFWAGDGKWVCATNGAIQLAELKKNLCLLVSIMIFGWVLHLKSLLHKTAFTITGTGNGIMDVEIWATRESTKWMLPDGG